MPRNIWLDKTSDIELFISETAGTLGMTRGEILQAVAASQNKSRQAVYFWIREIRSGKRPDVEVRFRAAVRKLMKEKGA